MSVKQSREKRFPIWHTIAFVAIPLVIVTIGVYAIRALPDRSGSDPYNLVNAWISALAFMAIIFSLRQQEASLTLQRRELRLQRRELELQRNELHATLEENKKMADAQVATEKRLFLSAYVSAANCLNDLHSMQEDRDYATAPRFLVGDLQKLLIRNKLSRLMEALDKSAIELFPQIVGEDNSDEVVRVLISAAVGCTDMLLINWDRTRIELDLADFILDKNDELLAAEADLYLPIQRSFNAWQRSIEKIKVVTEGNSDSTETGIIQTFWASAFDCRRCLEHMLVEAVNSLS